MRRHFFIVKTNGRAYQYDPERDVRKVWLSTFVTGTRQAKDGTDVRKTVDVQDVIFVTED